MSYLYIQVPRTTGRVLLASGALATLIVEWVMLVTRPFSSGMGQDFTTMYCAALAWRHGVDPYISQVPTELARALGVRWQGATEIPVFLPLVAPLTILSPRGAFVLYSVLVTVAVALSAWMLRRDSLQTLVIVACPATFLVCYFGQTGAFVCLAASSAWAARRAERPALLGLCVGLACIKPQLGLCVAVPLLWGQPRRAWVVAGVGLLSLLGLSVAVLGVPGLLSYVHGIIAFSRTSVVTSARMDGLGLSATGLPSWVRLIPLAVLVLMEWRGRGRPTEFTVATCCGTLPLLLPYSHQYDAVSLLPALLVVHRTLPKALWWTVASLVSITPLVSILVVPLPRLEPWGLIVWMLWSISAYARGRDAACASVSGMASGTSREQRGLVDATIPRPGYTARTT